MGNQKSRSHVPYQPKTQWTLHKVGKLCLLYILLVTLCFKPSDSQTSESSVPYGWEHMCVASPDPDILGLYVDDVTSIGRVMKIFCHVTGEMGKKWKFDVFRNWLRDFPEISVFLEVKCSKGGQLSLPWPMKARGLVGIKVSGCALADKYGDFNNPDISKLPDQLRVLDMRDSVWLSDGTSFEKITSPEGLSHLTSDYDCGQDSTIEYHVTSNVSFRILPSTTTDVTLSSKPGQTKTSSKTDQTKTSSKTDQTKTSTKVEPTPTRAPSRASTTGKDVTDLDLEKLLEGSASGNSGSGGESKSASSSETSINSLFDNPQTSGLAPASNSQKPETPTLEELLAQLSSSRNLSSSSSSSSSLSANRTSGGNDYLNLLESLQSLKLTCNFEKLRLLDESLPPFLPYHHFTLMVEGAAYPELRIMNYSYSGMRELPQELRNFRRYFPKLEYLDLSQNRLTQVNVSPAPRPKDAGYLTLDARYNKIKNLSLDDVTHWSALDGVFIDIRGNPLHCGCSMQSLVIAINSRNFFVEDLAQYDYIKNLECFSPPHLKGTKLSELKLLSCKNANYAASESSDRDSPSGGSMRLSSSTLAVILGCALIAVSLLAIAAVVMLIKYRNSQASAKKKLHEVSSVEDTQDDSKGELETVITDVATQ